MAVKKLSESSLRTSNLGGIGETDPYADQTPFLLHTTSTEDLQRNRGYRNVGAGVLSGNAAFSTTDPIVGPGSLYVDGTGDDVLFWPQGSGAQFYIAAGADFTVEFWCKRSAAGFYPPAIAMKASGTNSNWQIGYHTGNNVWFMSNNDEVNWSLGGTNTVGVWQHVAVVRKGAAAGNVKLYLDGVYTGVPQTYTGALGYASQPLYIGSLAPLGVYWTGYLAEIRITNGVGRYTADFAPPRNFLGSIEGVGDPSWGAVILLMKCDLSPNSALATLNGVRDASPSPKALTTNAGTVRSDNALFGMPYYDTSGGTNNYPTFAANAAFNFANTFTVEGWFWFISTSGTRPLFGVSTVSGLQWNTTNSRWEIILGSTTLSMGGSAPPTGQWVHVAAVKSVTTSAATYVTKLYINGVATGTTTTSSLSWGDGTNPFAIGWFGSNRLSGYVAEVRVSNIARYHTNFTPLRKPFPIGPGRP
jgi:hypothetical protein